MPEQPNPFLNPVGAAREWAERNAARAGENDLGERQPGMLNDFVGFVTGATDEGTQEYVDKIEAQKVEKRFKPQYTERGLDFPDGTTAAQAAKKIKDFDNQETIDNAVQTQNLLYNSPGNKRDRMVADRRWYAQQQENAQLRLDTLAAAERSERREDRRYNERMELEAKKDRRQAMQSLAAGLASLGAAFAL